MNNYDDHGAEEAAIIAERDQLRARVAELEAENDRLRRDRYDALSVTSRDGLLSSEWVARTGKAERERNEAFARVAELEAKVAFMPTLPVACEVKVGYNYLEMKEEK